MLMNYEYIASIETEMHFYIFSFCYIAENNAFISFRIYIAWII